MIFLSAPLACGIVYALFHLLLAAGIFRHRHISHPRRPQELISVIIAARNEAASIDATIRALQEQTLPPDEIIIADDRSIDRTAEIVSEIGRSDARIRCVTISELPEGLAPKKHALRKAIEVARGELLCFTDADCSPPPAWLEHLVGAFDEHTGVVTGTYVPREPASPLRSASQRLLFSFIRYEKLRATLLSIGALEVGHPWMASGASFAYRRKVYEEVGGFRGHASALSGDDDLFLQQVRRHTEWGIRAVLSDRAAVKTNVPPTVSAFIRQRQRHFSAGRSYTLSTQVLLAVYHATNAVSLGALIAWFFVPSPLLLGAYALKVSADLLLFITAERHISRSHDWALFLPMEFLYVVYILGVGALGRFGTPSWKESSPA